MSLYLQGQLNTTALSVPGVYTQILQPNNPVINGIPTNNVGYVGTATWGPVNVPTDFGTYAQGASNFGPMQPRQYDLMTATYCGTLQGANNITGVRVTDGTDTQATYALSVASTLAITFKAKYTGTFGNGIQVSVGPGSAASSFAVTVAAPGLPSERFDNLTGTGNALWVNAAAAINSGSGFLRGPSQIITALAAAGTGAPATATYTLSGGTDGVTTITAATLIGVDAIPRKGMYALRAQACSVINLADACDSTQFTLEVAFGTAEGAYMVDSTISGDIISTAATTLATAGIDSPWIKVMLGDWCLIADPVNGINRYVSPGAFVAGLISVYGPQYSGLNKQINGIVGTQKSATGQNYSDADIAAAVAGRIDIITNPVPGGSYFGCRIGHNTASNAAVRGDNYTRMTNYIATSINGSAGQFIGQLQGPSPNDPLRAKFKASLDTFFLNMQGQGQIADWQVICDLTNNSPSRIGQGYLQADIQVVYLSVVEKLIVNIQGGQTVTIQRTTIPVSQAA